MRYLVAIPCMDTVNTLTLKCLLNLKMPGETEISVTCSSLIYDARNLLAQKAVNEGFDRVLWLDSDMTFPPDLGMKLSEDLDQGYECMTGIYFKRKLPIKPVIYSGVYIEQEEDGSSTPKAEAYEEYPQDQIFDVAGMGFGGCMMSVDLIRRVRDQFGLPFSPILGFGEDLSFCLRASQIGTRMYCDSRVKLGHLGVFEVTESMYLSRVEIE